MTRSRNIYRKRGTGGFTNTGHFRIAGKGGVRQLEHIAMAEKALGKPLPAGAHVHHVNGKPGDNHTPWNLVVCPDAAYHKLLHVRTAALDACGHADWRRCRFCGRYAPTENLRCKPAPRGYTTQTWEHVECSRAWWNEYYRRRQAKRCG
jgi:hypothetical protein